MPIIKNNTENKTELDFVLSKPKYSIDDLILSPSIYRELERAIGLRTHQDFIFSKWGFSETHKYDKKSLINLYGPSGTGKTMAAHAIAKAMKKNLLIINYAEIESKYVGDTPKNIQAAFSFAEVNDAILFFDEADAMLSKRVTNMSSSTDTSVNQTRSVLLNILNEYSGTVIFATNFISNYDSAFIRRILINIEFSLPDLDSRKRLFNIYTPKALPQDFNFDYLADISESLNGSDISNAILLSAFTAKTNNQNMVHQKDLVDVINSIKKTKLANQNNSEIHIESKDVSEEYAKSQLNKEA